MSLENNSKYQTKEYGFNIDKIDHHKSKYFNLALLQLLECCHDVFTDGKKFGDEIEYSLVDQDYNPLLISKELLSRINCSHSYWMPEYGAWMIEGIPKLPYESIFEVQKNMTERRNYISSLLNYNQYIETLSICPFLGNSLINSNNVITESDYIQDNFIFPAERFICLTKNIKDRRKKKVNIILSSNSKFFKLDAMAFGMGCCSLQITLQAKSRYHCCQIHDIFALLGPIFLSLSSSTPIIQGKLVDTDSRWNIISQSTDDRIDNSYSPRFSNIPIFLLEKGTQWNNKPIPKNKETYHKLLEFGLSENMSTLFAHILYFDPLVMFNSHFNETSKENNALNTYMSTFWKSVRIKLPYLDLPDNSGWRVEFRVMDLQLSDFENAAFGICSILICKALIWKNFFPYSNITDIDEDFNSAVQKCSYLNHKFIWNNQRMTIKDIFDNNGKLSLIDICNDYLDNNINDYDEKQLYLKYLGYIYNIACGKKKTTAHNIRNQIKINNLDPSNLKNQDLKQIFLDLIMSKQIN